VFGKQHLRTAKCYEAIAELRLIQERYEEAIDYGNRMLDIRQTTLPEPHPEIINAIELLVRVETARGRSDDAANYAARAKPMADKHAAREASAQAKIAGG
jgi:hypothetical protein